MARKTIQQRRLEQKIKDLNIRDSFGNLVTVYVEKKKLRERGSDGRTHSYTEYGLAWCVIMSKDITVEQAESLKASCFKFMATGDVIVVED